MADIGSNEIRVLLLEDSDIDAQLVSDHLARAARRYRVHWTNSRNSFVEALGRREHDIVLADYSLPGFDGLTALNMARESSPDKPFIFVSGIVGEEFATNAMTRGATDYVVKRNLSRLPAAIERALAESREKAERIRAEEALRRLNSTLEDQVEARTRERDRIWRLSRDLFTVADREGRFIAANPAWWRTLGYFEPDVLNASFLKLTHEADLAKARELLCSMAQGEPVERFEARMRRKDGDFRWISWTAVPQGHEFYAVGRDITEERQAAADLAEANANLKAEISERERVEATLRQMQRLEAVGQLTSGVAHDFNNLLSVILGNVGFLERAATRARDDAKDAQRLNHIRLAAEKGARLTGQLLAFSRRQWLEPRPLDLNETVDGMRDLLQSTMGGAVQFGTALNPQLWPAMVDPTQIEMVILNLVINARDAMEVGGALSIKTDNVDFHLAERPEEPVPGEYVMLMVSDSGSGMTDEVLAKAFEPFFTTKGAGRGSGLGLAQVYGFAKQSGGGVRIETRVSQGTSVSVYLPRAPVPAAAVPAVVSAPTADDKPQGTEAPRATVLLVDDDAAVRNVTATILLESGYHVIEAQSGSEALRILGEELVNLLLVDYAMPGMNGVETAIAAVRLRPGLPVVYVTGYADLTALRNVGEDRIVQKPYRDEDLRRKLHLALSFA